MARLNLRNTPLGDRHLHRERLRRAAALEVPDWRLPDLPPDPIASPDPAALVVGCRLVELPGRPTERRGCFIGWGLHRQRGELLPIVRWDNTGHESFSDLKVLALEQQQMNTPHEKLDPLDRLRRECHYLVDRIATKPYGLKLLANVKQMMLVVLGYKAGRGQKLRD